MELVEFGPLTDELRAQVEGDEADPWDAARVPPLQWRGKEHHLALRDDGGRLIASAGLLSADVEVGGVRFPVVGLGGVIVNRAHRGRGLSLRVVEAALSKAVTLGPKFAVLFCHEDRIGLYRRFGFEVVHADVLVGHDGDRIVMPMHTMWRALTTDANWPDGRVEVDGPPF
jgi:predicted N-acetyltransferase YhbS